MCTTYTRSAYTVLRAFDEAGTEMEFKELKSAIDDFRERSQGRPNAGMVRTALHELIEDGSLVREGSKIRMTDQGYDTQQLTKSYVTS